MNTVNRITNPWIRPWNTKKFNDLYNRDERFFSILLKGTIAFLNNHIKMYNKGINHFIFNTGSSYMYVESNGYEFSWNETSGEDTMYMELPRCVVELSNIDIPTEELSQPFARGNYERKDEDKIKGFNAEIQRLPIELSLDLHYVFSNFNEGIVVLQELFDQLIFQRYFNIVYLGQIIQCSIEFGTTFNIELNKIDLAAAESNVRNLNIPVKICSNYPIINERTEISTSQIISKFSGFITQQGRNSYINILIDGVESRSNDVYVDLSLYDLNQDGQLNDSEITLIKEFIEKFDIDGDGEVTSYDINKITEEFYQNIYNIKYDVLNKGTLDMENLIIIKKLFITLDINHDNIVNQIEIDEIVKMINLFLKYDMNHDLKIDYNDINQIIQYILEHENLVYTELYSSIIQFIKNNFEDNFANYIINILETDLENYKLAIEWYIQENNLSIDQELLKELYEKLADLLGFTKYDFSNDGILNKDDIDLMMKTLNDNLEHEINYYISSEIIIHQNDHTLSQESITDRVQY